MRQLLVFALFVVTLGGIGYVGIHDGNAYFMSDCFGIARRVESELNETTSAALRAKDYQWAQIEMNGQIAVLYGEAPRQEERADAVALVQNAVGRGGFWRGGILSVRDNTTLAPEVSPYEWRVARDGLRVTLTGAVPTRSARADLVTYAETLFPGGVLDQMTIARGAPDETAWMTVARAALSQVANLNDGRAVMRDDRLRIDGAASSLLVKERIVSSIAKLPSPFVAVAQIEAPETDVGETAVAESAATELGAITDRGLCADTVAALLEGEEILFIQERSVIEKESYPLLDRLALAARRCSGFSVMVVGVAGDGQEALARSRAQAVADFFVLEYGSAYRVDVSTVIDPDVAGENGPVVRFRIHD